MLHYHAPRENTHAHNHASTAVGGIISPPKMPAPTPGLCDYLHYVAKGFCGCDQGWWTWKFRNYPGLSSWAQSKHWVRKSRELSWAGGREECGRRGKSEGLQAWEGLSRLLLALRCRVACAKTRKTTPRAKEGRSRLKGRGTSVLRLQGTNSADTLNELGNRFSPEPPHKNPASGTLFSLVRPTAEKLPSPPGFLTCRAMRSALLGHAVCDNWLWPPKNPKNKNTTKHTKT